MLWTPAETRTLCTGGLGQIADWVQKRRQECIVAERLVGLQPLLVEPEGVRVCPVCRASRAISQARLK
jgi:hypothetical protein